MSIPLLILFYLLVFTIKLQSLKKQQLVIDFAIDFLRKNGTSNQKVFKLKTLNAEKGQQLSLAKFYSFKAITTRQYYLGAHQLNVQINGKIVASQAFRLI